MHKVDRLELLANVWELVREANCLLAEATMTPHTARLRRIIMILRYMREHLEMVNYVGQPGDARPRQSEPDCKAG